MRLLEEKTSVMLQIISLVVITSSTIFTQIANNNISDYSTELLLRRFKIEEAIIQCGEFEHDLDKIGLASMLNSKLDFINDLIPDEQLGAIYDKYKNGSLSYSDLEQKLRDYYRKKFVEADKLQKFLVKSFNDYKNKGCVWQLWRDWIFVPIQFVGVILLVLGYTQLLLSISKRTRKPPTG